MKRYKPLKESLSKKYLSSLWDDTKVFVINGNELRDNYETDFIGGGHGYVYPELIPKDEIWVEDMESKNDQEEILMHEIVEWYMMKYQNKEYEEAHNIATSIERVIRHVQGIVK